MLEPMFIFYFIFLHIFKIFKSPVPVFSVCVYLERLHMLRNKESKKGKEEKK